MKKLMLSAVVAFALVGQTASAEDYEPPAEPGDIYIAFRYHNALGLNAKTTVTVTWGPYSHTESYSPPWWGCEMYPSCGFVVKLHHNKRDKVPLTVWTDGEVIYGPDQSSLPSTYSGYPLYNWSWWTWF